jgi:hypothetical protein
LKKNREKAVSKTTKKQPPKKEAKFYSAEQINEMIQRKAYEIYLKRSGKPGDHISDWLVAEKLVKSEIKRI